MQMVRMQINVPYEDFMTFSVSCIVFVYPLPKLHLGIVFYQKACAHIFIQALKHLVAPPKL